MPRIDPLSPPYEPAADARLSGMMPAGAPPIALFRTFARNMPMTDAIVGWGGYVLSAQLSLSLRDRELLIDRTTARCGCEYEWGVHIAFFAEAAQLTPDQIRSLTHGAAGDRCWSERDRLLIELADALHDVADIDDELWRRLVHEFTDAQLLDACMICGWYHAISYVATGARVELEPGAPLFADVG
ncbi:MAG: carboxymuconolactone decarboxylase family protein [Actinomycetota bacterium]